MRAAGIRVFSAPGGLFLYLHMSLTDHRKKDSPAPPRPQQTRTMTMPAATHTHTTTRLAIPTNHHGDRGGGSGLCGGRGARASLSTHAVVFLTVVFAASFMVASLSDVRHATERTRQLLAAPVAVVTPRTDRTAGGQRGVPSDRGPILPILATSSGPASVAASLVDAIAAPLPPAPPETEWLLENNFAPTACAKHGRLNRASTTVIIQSVPPRPPTARPTYCQCVLAVWGPNLQYAHPAANPSSRDRRVDRSSRFSVSPFLLAFIRCDA